MKNKFLELYKRLEDAIFHERTVEMSDISDDLKKLIDQLPEDSVPSSETTTNEEDDDTGGGGNHPGKPGNP